MDFNLSQILDSNILLEGRKEDAIKKYGEEHTDLVNLLSDVDPSGNNKYLNWMVKMSLGLGAGDFIPTADNVARQISIFHRNLQRIKNKDINSYKDFQDFMDVVAEALVAEEDVRVSKEADKIYEDKDVVIMAPFTVEASCKYGAGSKWCIASTNNSNSNPHFDDYSKHSNFYFFINKEMTKNNIGGRDYKYALQWRFDGSNKHTWWDAQDSSSNNRPSWVTDEMMDVVTAYNPKHTKKKLNTQIAAFLVVPKVDEYQKFRDFITDEQRVETINKIIFKNENLNSNTFKILSGDLNEKQINDFITKYVVGDVSVSDYENMKTNLNVPQTESLIINNPRILNNYNVMKDLNDNMFDDEMKYNISTKVNNKEINNTDSKVLMKKWSMTPEQIEKHNKTSFYVFLSSDKDGNLFTSDGLVKVDPLDPESYRVINMMKLKKQVQDSTNMYGVKTKHGLLDEYLNNTDNMSKEILDMIKEKSITIG